MLPEANCGAYNSAFQRFVPRSLGITVGAARDIQAGEEITISCKKKVPAYFIELDG